MKIKNLTPFLFGSKVTSRRPPAPEMVLIVRARFKLEPGAPVSLPEGHPVLAQGTLRGDVFRDDDDDQTGECLYPSDFADFKPQADVLLRGTHTTPRGEHMTECPARFSVGAWSKILLRPQTPTAGFGPLSPHRPERRNKLGKNYGKSYRKERAPYFADDFDWAYFNAAPPDQRLPYLRGDEELLFQNLHPAAEVFQSRLPGLRIRAFASDLQGRFREVPMNLDTLLADLDEGALYLVWRGLTEAKEDDLSDQTALIASEPLAEPPLPESHYRDILQRFQADPLEIAEHLPPELAEEWRALEALEKRRAAAAPLAGAPDEAPLSSLLEALLGGLAKPEQERIRGAMQSLSRVALPDGKLLGGVLGEALRARRLDAAVAAPLSPGASPPVIANAQSRRAFRALARAVEEARARAAARGKPLQGMDAWDKLCGDPKLAALGFSPVEPRDPGEIGPGSDLSGQDLSDRDLSGRDLSGADLSGAILSGTNLRGSAAPSSRARSSSRPCSSRQTSGAPISKARI
jgi:hypothetical protein